MRSRQRPQKKHTTPTVDPTESGDNDDAEIFSIEDSQQIANVFKDFLLPRDKNIVIEKLKDTVAVRRYDLDNDRIIFEKNLHLYIVDTALVSCSNFRKKSGYFLD